MTVVQPCEFIKSHQTIFLRWVNLVVGKLYFNKGIKVQGKKKLFLIEELWEQFLQLVRFKLDLKGQVLFESENKQRVPDR